MISRTKRILNLVISNDKNFLDLPKYESTKTSSRDDQAAALLAKDKLLEQTKCNLPFNEIQKENGDKRRKEKKQENDENIVLKDISYQQEESKKEFKDKQENMKNSHIKDSRNEQLNLSDDADLSESEYIPETLTDSSETEKEDISLSILKRKASKANRGNIDGTIAAFGNVIASTSKVEHFSNYRPWTKKNTCPYCLRDVTHFPRHLVRKHKDEGAVKELLSMTLKNPKRKVLLNAIRRQGNFSSNSQVNIICPIRRPKDERSCDMVSNSQGGKKRYIVCQSRLRYFSRNYLRRHRRLCCLRTEKASEAQEKHLSAAQLFAVCSGYHNKFFESLRLKKEVFPIMRNDDISRIAMGDTFICSYAESLLRKHMRPQIRNVTSNKMRELGRLLVAIKTVTGAQILFDVMKPEMFDHFVSATKVISGYNNETRTFGAESLALHMGTTLKQVCDVATKLLIQKSNLLICHDPEQRLKDIKRLRNLIENHWNSEISSLALKNLNEKKYNKPKLMPLTSDIIKLQQYVMKEAEETYNKLADQETQKKTEYKRLSECVLALTLLLNRKRISKIQYLTLKTYTSTPLHNAQEEFIQSLSGTERTLTQSFKRVVTPGKGSKPVLILFSKSIQQFIEILLKTRNIYIPQENQYLFANPNTVDRSLSGYHCVKNLAEKSGVSDATVFTSTRLRKQIATILQVLNVTDSEFEQFASLMGHTKKTHAEYYRLPQDIYQTAKVSKLLLAINSGKGHKYQGKTLEDIKVSDDLESDGDERKQKMSGSLKSWEMGNHSFPSTSVASVENDVNMEVNHGSQGGKKPGKKIDQRQKWTEEQKREIKTFFKKHIKNKKAPRKYEVDEFVRKYPTNSKNRNWIQIKSYVYNCYKLLH